MYVQSNTTRRSMMGCKLRGFLAVMAVGFALVGASGCIIVDTGSDGIDHPGRTVDCPEGDCDIHCGNRDTCKVDCQGGFCDVDCANSDECRTWCDSGDCDINCDNSYDCSLYCPGHYCTLDCGTATSCGR